MRQLAERPSATLIVRRSPIAAGRATIGGGGLLWMASATLGVLRLPGREQLPAAAFAVLLGIAVVGLAVGSHRRSALVLERGALKRRGLWRERTLAESGETFRAVVVPLRRFFDGRVVDLELWIDANGTSRL